MPTTVVNKRKESFDVYIGRPSKWGNPFAIGPVYGSRELVIAAYKIYIAARPDLQEAAKRELRGKRLGCFCKPLACHGDILAEIADSE